MEPRFVILWPHSWKRKRNWSLFARCFRKNESGYEEQDGVVRKLGRRRNHVGSSKTKGNEKSRAEYAVDSD